MFVNISNNNGIGNKLLNIITERNILKAHEERLVKTNQRWKLRNSSYKKELIRRLE